jgi:excisionase family DNA binding protein
MDQASTRRTYTIEECAKQLGISRAKAYEAAREGRFPALRFGKRWTVPAAAFDRMLDEVKPLIEVA